MLVPDLDQDELGVKNESVDGPKLTALLKQVLEANGPKDQEVPAPSSVKTEIIADAQFLRGDDWTHEMDYLLNDHIGRMIWDQVESDLLVLQKRSQSKNYQDSF